MKLCKRCKTEKDESEFYGGKYKWCRECCRAYRREYYAKKLRATRRSLRITAGGHWRTPRERLAEP